MPRQRKSPLTLAEHEAMGETLYRIRTTLSSMIVWVGNTYRKKNMRQLVRIERGLDRLRSALDDEVYREFPDRGHPANAYVYYPGAVKPLDTSGIEWDVPMICGLLAQWASELRAIANQLFRAYPVALGDRVLRCAELLAFEAIELPYHLGEPKRRWAIA